VGFKRNIRRSALAVALILAASGADAAPAGPRLVAARPDPNLVLLTAQAEESGEQPLDQATERFRLAIVDALQSDQRAVEEACRSRPATDASSSTRFAWEARCLYRRR
jgi:hypothetical protein